MPSKGQSSGFSFTGKKCLLVSALKNVCYKIFRKFPGKCLLRSNDWIFPMYKLFSVINNKLAPNKQRKLCVLFLLHYKIRAAVLKSPHHGHSGKLFYRVHQVSYQLLHTIITWRILHKVRDTAHFIIALNFLICTFW